jgi:hypothetical protein
MKGELQMKLYVVIEVIDDYPEDGGGEYPDAVFLNYINAEKYATRKRQEAIAWDKTDVYYRVETWETADERENAE